MQIMYVNIIFFTSNTPEIILLDTDSQFLQQFLQIAFVGRTCRYRATFAYQVCIMAAGCGLHYFGVLFTFLEIQLPLLNEHVSNTFYGHNDKGKQQTVASSPVSCPQWLECLLTWSIPTTGHFVFGVQRRFFGKRVSYCTSHTATFNIFLLSIHGDVHPHPGPRHDGPNSAHANQDGSSPSSDGRSSNSLFAKSDLAAWTDSSWGLESQRIWLVKH